MRILYVAPQIANFGGLVRVLSIKLNYLAEKGYDIHLLTQNKGRENSIFDVFNSKIKQHDITLNGNKLLFFFRYRKQINQKIKEINPDIIVVCDNGLKGYLLPFIVKTKIPLLFESHGSKYIQETEPKAGIINSLLQRLVWKFKDIGIKKYSKLILLTPAIAKDWKHDAIEIINNPIWFRCDTPASLISKKAIAVGRHSYEKGFDRMLNIWKRIIQKHPEWVLDIYGDSNGTVDLKVLADYLAINENVNFYSFSNTIEEKYPDYSICMMTSRSEGFPMVAIEAMTCGLPVIAYDCPGGIQGIVTNNYNGFLIEDGKEDAFYNQLNLLIENHETRETLGKNARESVQKLSIESIMKQWEELFDRVYKDK